MFTCLCKPPKIHNEDRSFNPLETPKEKIIKMVLLGPSGSGKTTLIKQFQRMSGFDAGDIQNVAPYIKDSIVTSMKALCAESLALEQTFNGKRAIESLRNEMLSLQESHELTKNIALKINELWCDDKIKSILLQRECFQRDDNIEYFLNKIEDIASDDYAPDFEDYVRMKKMSIGFSRTKFMKSIDNFGEYFFEVVDVGGARSERKKWWSHDLLKDPHLNALVYVVPISDYDLLLFEDDATNRLIEALDLFQQIMFETDYFKDKPLVLLFNKYDVFVNKIKNMPITVCFDDFPRHEMSPNDPEHVMRFVASKFLHILTDNDVDLKGPLRIFKSTALDTDNVEQVFNKMIPHIICRQNVNIDISSYQDIDESN